MLDKNYLDFGYGVVSGTADGVTVSHGASRAEDAVALTPADKLPHLCQDSLLHESEDWRHLVCVDTGVEGIRQPLAHQTVRVNPTHTYALCTHAHSSQVSYINHTPK